MQPAAKSPLSPNKPVLPAVTVFYDENIAALPSNYSSP